MMVYRNMRFDFSDLSVRRGAIQRYSMRTRLLKNNPVKDGIGWLMSNNHIEHSHSLEIYTKLLQALEVGYSVIDSWRTIAVSFSTWARSMWATASSPSKIRAISSRVGPLVST